MYGMFYDLTMYVEFQITFVYCHRKVGQIVDSYVSGRTTYWKIWFDPDWYYETA